MHSLDSPVIICLAGEMGSGKGTVAKHIISQYGGKKYRYSTILRDILDRLYLPHERANLQKMSTILRKQLGEDVFSRVIAEDVKNIDSRVVVVDGVRRLSDILYLQKNPGFVLCYVDVNLRTRYERIHERHENPDDQTITFEQFVLHNKDETELQIPELKPHAHYIFDNNGTLEDLIVQVDYMLAKLL